jgi:hypothetical protein
MTHHLLASLCLASAFAGAVRAEPKPAAPGKGPGKERKGKDADPKAVLAAAAVQQAKLKRRFESSRQKLVILAARLERGSPADKAQSRTLRAALRLIRDRRMEAKFDAQIRGLTAKGADKSIDRLSLICRDNQKLCARLEELIALLSSADSDTTRPLEKRNLVLAERRFHLARGKLLALASRLEARAEPEDKVRARVLRAALASAENHNPEGRVHALMGALAVSAATRAQLDLADLMLDRAQTRADALARDLKRAGADTAALAEQAADLAEEVLPAAHKEIGAFCTAYERILKEADLKSQERSLSPGLYTTISQPLRQINEGQFTRAQKALQAVKRALRNSREPAAARLKAAGKQALLAQREVLELRRQLEDAWSSAEIWGCLLEIHEAETEQRAAVRRIIKKELEDLLK